MSSGLPPEPQNLNHSAPFVSPLLRTKARASSKERHLGEMYRLPLMYRTRFPGHTFVLCRLA